MLVSIGEVQSHVDCLSQLGIYTIGQFRAKDTSAKKMDCIAVFKDKTSIENPEIFSEVVVSIAPAEGQIHKKC